MKEYRKEPTMLMMGGIAPSYLLSAVMFIVVFSQASSSSALESSSSSSSWSPLSSYSKDAWNSHYHQHRQHLLQHQHKQKHHHHHHHYRDHNNHKVRHHREMRQKRQLSNRHQPRFSHTEYQGVVHENAPVLTSILQVRATDDDFDENGLVRYSVSDPEHFAIDEGGIIYNIKPLDYEHTGGQYVFNVVAEDQGETQSMRKRSEAMAYIRVVNTPEAPVFDSDQYLFAVTEFAKPGSYVGTVVARDADGDFDHYELQGNTLNFVIDRNNGIISVLNKNFGDLWVFNFFAVAVDGRGQRTQVPVKVNIIDENTNKPVFPYCDSYQKDVIVSENQTSGVNVLMVVATDADHGENGVVTYSLLNSFESFEIETINGNGQIKTIRRLDREGGDKDFFLTVIAKDSAPKDALQEACSFQVTVKDINDNPPIFDQQRYEQNIATDHSVDSPVLRVTATDMDAENNSAVEYTLESNSRNDDLSYFKINVNNGIISLNKSLSDSMSNTKSFRFTAIAKDKGTPRLSSTASVTINVVSSDNLPPTILSVNLTMDKLPEDANVGTNVAIVCAKSNIDGSPNVYFTLVNGNTREANEEGTFALNRLADNDPRCPPNSKGAVIYLAVRNLDYESVTVYKLILQVANDANARADDQIIIHIDDVNDNPPVPQPFEGSVVENNDKTLITTIMAIDKDISAKYRNLKYYFGNEVSPSVLSKFTLYDSGDLWTKGPLDREAEKQYRIPVRVTDGAYNSSYAYWITVQDVNDVAPEFDKEASKFEVVLSETREVDKATGIKLVVIDPDVVNHNEFQIVTGNEDQKFRIDLATGDVLVNKPLDYDEPINDRNFTMKVRLSDGANPPADVTIVIAVQNANDLQPVFDQPSYSFQVTENADCDFHFGDVTARDPDLPPNAYQNITYELFYPDDRNFTIGEKTGQLKTQGCLDREAVPRGQMEIYPRAKDEGGYGHDADPASVMLTILDVNDNHPYIQSPDNSYAKIMENLDPKTVKPIAIQLDDRDSEENGCPCSLEFESFTSADIINKFSVQEINRSVSLYELRPLKMLDREQQKFYEIPFRTTDNKNFQGTRYLTLEVGDVNDSPMTDGSSTIEVFNYQGQFPAMVIGTVYVTDQDDHDIADKNFEFDATTGPETELYFTVDHDSGEITMKKGTPEGEHILRVKVHDKFRNETAIGKVTIKVVDLTEEAVMNSGSLRIADITAMELISQKDSASTGTSKYDLLKEEIGKTQGVSPSDVYIFSLRDVDGGVDIRYNCESPSFFTAPRLNGLMMSRRQQIMRSLDINIPLVDINMCLYEPLSPCNQTSCQQSLRPNLTHPMLLSSETSTVVGVDITDDYTCSCGPLEPLPSVCYDGFCYNGGTCETFNNTLVCRCPDDQDYGPRCELRTARFERGYSWYEPFTMCDNSSISLSFESKEKTGILLYSGPMVSRPWADYPKDFIYVVINQLILETYLDFGTGTVKLKIPLRRANQPYNYSVTWNETSITVEVPNCQGNTTIDNPDCKVSVPLPGKEFPSHLLNVQGPLQLGGVAAMESFSRLASSYGWSYTPPTIDPFYGCILELRHNDFLYDLNSTDYGKDTFMPCSAPAAARIILGEQSIIIIVVSLLCLLLLVLLILCLARRRQKSISYPDLDGIVKETIGGTDLEGFGEKDIDQYDLKLLRVGPNGHLFNGEDTRRLPDVAEDAHNSKAPLAQMPEGLSIGDFINENIKKIDREPTEFDDVRHYCFEGDEMSIASLSSIGSGTSSEADNVFEANDNWGPRFDKLNNIFKRDPDEEDDSEYDFKIPRQPRRYSLHKSPEKSSPSGNPTKESSASSSGNKPSGRPLQSPTVTFAEAKTQGSREGLLPQESDDHHDAINPLASYALAEGKESWC